MSRAFDADGNEVVGELGELVITKPMPSMPVALWNDPGGERYRAAYFSRYPGVWRQGDWIKFTERGSCVITGRSDATLNRGGVRLGTGEFYAVVEDLPEVVDSSSFTSRTTEVAAASCCCSSSPAAGSHVDDELRAAHRRRFAIELSPRHVPDAIVAVPAIPRTLTAKKLELPVKQILVATPPENVASRDALAQPDSLDAFVAYAATREESAV